MERFTIVATPDHVKWGRELRTHAIKIAERITSENLADLIGEAILHHLEKSEENLDSEIVLWARSDKNYLAAWTSTHPQPEVVGQATCEMNTGLVADVFSSETARTENEPDLEADKFTNLGKKRDRSIHSMRALPISAFGRCVAVVTWVGYEGESTSADRDEITKVADVIEIATQLTLLKKCLALSEDL